MHLLICCKSRLRNRQIQFKISVGSLTGNGGVKTDRIIYDTRKVKVLSLPKISKEKSTFRAKALLSGVTTNSRRRAFARNDDFSFIVSDSEKTFTFRVSLNTLPTLATLGRIIYPYHIIKYSIQ